MKKEWPGFCDRSPAYARFSGETPPSAPVRRIYILLTQFPNTGSKFVSFFSGCPYNHASIGLDEDLNTFYSFVCKGFIVENITRYVSRPGRSPFPCRLYELEVTEEVYASVRARLLSFSRRKQELHYTYFGLILSMMRIPYQRRNYYFCSQFVAEMLRDGRAASLRKHRALYLPGDLRRVGGLKELYRGNLRTMLAHFGLLPPAPASF